MRAVGPVLVWLYRVGLVARDLARRALVACRWLARSREITNFTYELAPRNRRQLAAFLVAVTGASETRVLELMRELEEDQELRDHVRQATAAHADHVFADAEPRYGRRAGWYVLARLLRPRVVVESGVDKGLGACVLAAALERNAQEGHPGFYYGLDVNPASGYLLQGRYERFGWMLLGDSIESLKELEEIGLFVQDSDHSETHEAREYETLESRLTEDAVVLSDNAHVTDALHDFADRTGRRFLYFAEDPADHWYAGAGIGAAWNA
jgi:predicted O-methyltransferase YrrM